MVIATKSVHDRTSKVAVSQQRLLLLAPAKFRTAESTMQNTSPPFIDRHFSFYRLFRGPIYPLFQRNAAHAGDEFVDKTSRNRKVNHRRPDGHLIRRHTVNAGLPLTTDLQSARAVIEAMRGRRPDSLHVIAWNDHLIQGLTKLL